MRSSARCRLFKKFLTFLETTVLQRCKIIKRPKTLRPSQCTSKTMRTESTLISELCHVPAQTLLRWRTATTQTASTENAEIVPNPSPTINSKNRSGTNPNSSIKGTESLCKHPTSWYLV